MKEEDFIAKIRSFGETEAIASQHGSSAYEALARGCEKWQAYLKDSSVPVGAVVSLLADYGSESISLFLALMKTRAIIVPITPKSAVQKEKFIKMAEVEWQIELVGKSVSVRKTGLTAGHSIYGKLREMQHSGIVLFSSGSTGEPKAAVHDMSRILKRYDKTGAAYRTLVFLQMDHIGGINTLFYTISNGGTIVIPRNRSPREVFKAVEKHRVELLPTSPTFLNLLLISSAYKNYDLSSLKLITYGTESMPQSTLERVKQILPHVRLKQTYGLSELGILHSKSRDDTSLWLRLGGNGFKIKVEHGRLWIKSESAMLGYLNAVSPFDDDGYFDTGDLVEEDGEWIRILGRESDLINVGGNKVFPAEVENILMQMDEVEDVLVHGEPNLITGKTVSAVVKLRRRIPLNEFKARMRLFCRGKLEPYKIPLKVKITDESLHSARFKKNRMPKATREANSPKALERSRSNEE